MECDGESVWIKGTKMAPNIVKVMQHDRWLRPKRRCLVDGFETSHILRNLRHRYCRKQL